MFNRIIFLLIFFILYSCKVPQKQAQVLIRNGTEVDIEKEYPAVAYFAFSLKVNMKSEAKITSIADLKPNVFCTGTLVEKNVIITAGHCGSVINSKNRQDVEYYVFFYRDKTNYYKISKVEISPEVNYYSSHYDYSTDLALIRLKTQVNDIIPVELNFSAKESGQNSEFYGIGVGSNAEFNEGNYKRRGHFKYFGFFKSIDRSQGQDGIYDVGKLGIVDFKYELLLVVPGDENKQMVCSGDSGGPLFFLENGKEKLYGVLSGGFQRIETTNGVIKEILPKSEFNVCKNERFGAYALVANQQTWIEKTIAALKEIHWWEKAF